MVINVLFAGNGQGAAPDADDRIWRPLRLHSRPESANGDDHGIREPFRTLRNLLNKLSPSNFCKITERFKSLLVDNPVFLDQSAAFLVEKAITERLFSKWYVEMLCSVSNGLTSDAFEDSVLYRIRVLFVEKLILSFNGLITRESGEEDREITVIETAELQEQLNETEFRYRRKFIGAGRVIAESFILGILSLNSLNQCIESLISSPKETSLVCLCTLMTTVGKTLEFHLNDDEINDCFLKIKKILDHSSLSTKSRYLILNLLQCKENLWTPTSVTRDLLILEQELRVLSEFYKTKNNSTSATISETNFLIEAAEASSINNMFNNFSRCPRNLAGVINLFSELAAEEKTKLVRLFIMCVTKGDIYSADCGNLFACLAQSRNLIIPDIILGVKTVIHGYCKQLIFADQQIWIRLKEIFQPLLAADVFSLNDLEDDGDLQKARQIEENKEKQMKKKPISTSQKAPLSWRRGLPVVKKDRGVLKKPSEADTVDKSDEAESKKDEDES